MQAVIRIDMSWLIIVIISIIVAAGVGVCIAFLYASYRRDHPRKIKLKIKTVIQEDLAAKRVATSVKEVLGDEEEKKKLDEEIAILESEDDLDDDAVDTMTFIERIYAANSELKYYYSEVKNELLSYEGITHTIDRKFEIFYHGTRQVAKLSICNGILRLYVNLDPQKYDKRQYNQRDMSKFECHEKTPLRINVNSLETLRHAKVFIRIIRKKEKLEAVTGFVRIDYEKFYTLKENFIPKIFKNVFIKNQKNKDGKK
jgi:predicted transport protein